VLIDYPHESLDAIGMVEGVGTVADLANAVLYCFEGDIANAGWSAAAAVPILGAGATAAKWGKGVVKYLRHFDPGAFNRLMQLGARDWSTIETTLREAGTNTVIRGMIDKAGNQILLRAGNNKLGLLHIIGRHLTGDISGEITTFFPKRFKVDDVINVTAQAIQKGSRTVEKNSNWIYRWHHEVLGEINVIVTQAGEVVSAFPTR
jgi:hypothetical protein